METVRMGYEGMVYIGPPGSTAGTLVENCRDITEELQHERGDTTVRGDSTSRPIKTESVSIRGYTLEITVLNDSSDPVVGDLKDAAASGDALAVRTVDYAGGVGYDGEMTFSKSAPKPLNGEQVITFSGTPNRGHGRAPLLNA